MYSGANPTASQKSLKPGIKENFTIFMTDIFFLSDFVVVVGWAVLEKRPFLYIICCKCTLTTTTLSSDDLINVLMISFSLKTVYRNSAVRHGFHHITEISSCQIIGHQYITVYGCYTFALHITVFLEVPGIVAERAIDVQFTNHCIPHKQKKANKQKLLSGSFLTVPPPENRSS